MPQTNLALNSRWGHLLASEDTGHELSHLGLGHFLRKHESLVKDAHAWIHLGANFSARDGRVVLQASNKNYMNMLQTQLLPQDDTEAIMIPVGQRPLGEAGSIYGGGGQFVSILGINPLFHHPHDRWQHATDLQ